MSFQEETVVNAAGEFLLIVSDVNECAIGILIHIAIDDGFHQIAIAEIQAMKRFIEDEQIRRLHESACQEYQALFATRHFEEFAVCQMSDAKNVHPFQALLFLFFAWLEIESDGILESAGHNL